MLELFAAADISVNVVESPGNTCMILTDSGKDDAAKVNKIKQTLRGLGNVAKSATVGWITCAEDGERSIEASNRDFGNITTELYRARIPVIHFTALPGEVVSLLVPEKKLVSAVRCLHETVVVHS